MMYSEFLEISNYTERYISFAEYSTFVEPIYMECELTKQDFVQALKDAFKQLVHPVVEKAIHNLPMMGKLSIIEGSSQQLIEHIEKIDFEARKLAYQYIKLLLAL